MDWLASARMHFFEIIALRGVTAIPMLTLGFTPTALQTYIGIVYIYSALLHANLRGDFDRLAAWVADAALPPLAPWDRKGSNGREFRDPFSAVGPAVRHLFHAGRRWPSGYGVPEEVPHGYVAQFLYPFRRKQPAEAVAEGVDADR